ncbi:hypothetical protein TNCV_3408871 [Trichonephila clavipes]|nr:hypothetical protein TNCV_3408871 [Trichonephila clavipes]
MICTAVVRPIIPGRKLPAPPFLHACKRDCPKTYPSPWSHRNSKQLGDCAGSDSEQSQCQYISYRMSCRDSMHRRCKTYNTTLGLNLKHLL